MKLSEQAQLRKMFAKVYHGFAVFFFWLAVTSWIVGFLAFVLELLRETASWHNLTVIVVGFFCCGASAVCEVVSEEFTDMPRSQ